MHNTGAILGGETAGHIFFGDPAFKFDDAILATAKMVTLLSQSARSLSAMLSRLPQYIRAPQRRLRCPDKLKGSVVKAICNDFSGRNYKVDRLDGAKVYFDGGWALFRASNTQPAVTLHCEATTVDALNTIHDTMLCAIQKTLAHLGVQLDSAH
jgi:phosphomannomutase/phosphoglucomutase